MLKVFSAWALAATDQHQLNWSRCAKRLRYGLPAQETLKDATRHLTLRRNRQGTRSLTSVRLGISIDSSSLGAPGTSG